MPRSPRPYLYFAAVVALWAASPTLLNRLIADGLSVLFILTAANTIAALVLLTLAALTGRLREIAGYPARDGAAVVGMGLIGVAGYLSFYYLAFAAAPDAPDEINVVNYLWPVFMVLLARPILGERHSVSVWVGIGLSFVGTAGIVTRWEFRVPAPQHADGYALAAAGAVCWALFSNLGKRLPYDKLAGMALYFTVGALVFHAAQLAVGVDRWPAPDGWLRLLFLGGAVNGLASFLWFKALAGGPVAIFGNLIFLTPFLSLLYLRLFAGTPLRGGVWLSLALIVLGALIGINSLKRQP